nr:hypothetical protein [Alicyclobacillus mengziensis]
MVDIYRENGKKRERFSHFARRYSVNALRERVFPSQTI